MAGLTLAEASSVNFVSAFRKCISETLEIHETAISNVTAMVILQRSRSRRRKLLNDISMSYSVTVGNNQSIETYEKKFKKSISDDTFRMKLVNYSGITISGVYDVKLTITATGLTRSPSNSATTVIFYQAGEK